VFWELSLMYKYNFWWSPRGHFGCARTSDDYWHGMAKSIKNIKSSFANELQSDTSRSHLPAPTHLKQYKFHESLLDSHYGVDMSLFYLNDCLKEAFSIYNSIKRDNKSSSSLYLNMYHTILLEFIVFIATLKFLLCLSKNHLSAPATIPPTVT
jgi:hypothetical protein